MVEDTEDKTQDGLEREDKLFVRNIMSSFLSVKMSVKIKKTQRNIYEKNARKEELQTN